MQEPRLPKGLRLDGYRRMVKAAWERAKARGDTPTLMHKTSDVHSELHVWDKEILKGPNI
jgi:hypothetical protein